MDIQGHQVTCGFCLMEGKKEEIFCIHLEDTILSLLLHIKEVHPERYKIIFDGLMEIEKRIKDTR